MAHRERLFAVSIVVVQVQFTYETRKKLNSPHIMENGPPTSPLQQIRNSWSVRIIIVIYTVAINSPSSSYKKKKNKTKIIQQHNNASFKQKGI